MKQSVSPAVIVVVLLIVVVVLAVVGFKVMGKKNSSDGKENPDARPPGAPGDGQGGSMMPGQADAMNKANMNKGRPPGAKGR